jgi:hypothetical protein
MQRDTMISEETIEGFTVRFYATYEDLDPRGEFMNEDGSDDEETIAKIHSGEYYWFRAEAVASKEGVELGSDHLGACCYDSYAQFLESGGYSDDMRAAAIEQAKETLAKLCAS